MVKTHQKDSKKRLTSKHFNPSSGRAMKINASTAYGTCSEQISPFGGLLGLTKTLELFDFEKLFNENFHAPSRENQAGRLRHGHGACDAHVYRIQTGLAFCLHSLGGHALRHLQSG